MLGIPKAIPIALYLQQHLVLSVIWSIKHLNSKSTFEM